MFTKTPSKNYAIAGFPGCPGTADLEKEDDSNVVVDKLLIFLNVMGFEIFDFDEPEISSFWQKIWAKTKSKATKDEIKNAFEKSKESFEIQNISKPKSESDLNRAQAAAELLKALGNDSKSTAIYFGELLILTIVDNNGDKHNRVMTLSREQNEFIQSNLNILKNPAELLNILDNRSSMLEYNKN
jgi:hypothetical protein